jgi:hypothetical protein
VQQFQLGGQLSCEISPEYHLGVCRIEMRAPHEGRELELF